MGSLWYVHTVACSLSWINCGATVRITLMENPFKVLILMENRLMVVTLMESQVRANLNHYPLDSDYYGYIQ